MGVSYRPDNPFAGSSAYSPDNPFATRAPFLRRVGTALKEMVTHPVETAKGIVTAPLHAAKTGAEFIGQSAAELTLPDDVRGYALADPERISERDAFWSAAQLASLGPGARLLSAIPKVGVPLAGAAAGAAFAPDDPAVGTFLGAAGGALAKGVPAAVRRVRAAWPETPVVPRETPRVPAELAAERLAQATKPQALDAPVSTGAARDLVAQLESILEPNRVKPKGGVAPVAPEAFPEGYSTASSRVGRIPAAGAASYSPDNPFVAKAEAPVVEPPAAGSPDLPPVIGEPASFGRDLAEPSRIPADAPKVPRPRGAEPSGTVETPEGAVSTGPRAVPAPPKVTAEQMLALGKQRAAELESGALPRSAPDLTPAMEREGRMFAEPMPEPGAPVPTPAPAPVMPVEPVIPNPATAPRDYLNYAKFGLDRATEARLRTTVEGLRKTGEVEKGYQSFAEQQAHADAVAKEFIQNPLDIDRAKLAKLSGAEIVGLRTVAAENTRLVEGLSRAMESGELTMAELAEANRLLDQAVTSTNDVLGAIVRETAQKGRDLGFLRQVAKLTTDPDVWVVRAKKMLGDRPLSDTMMLEIRKLAREAAEACA